MGFLPIKSNQPELDESKTSMHLSTFLNMIIGNLSDIINSPNLDFAKANATLLKNVILSAMDSHNFVVPPKAIESQIPEQKAKVEEIRIIRRSSRNRRPYSEWSKCLVCDCL